MLDGSPRPLSSPGVRVSAMPHSPPVHSCRNPHRTAIGADLEAKLLYLDGEATASECGWTPEEEEKLKMIIGDGDPKGKWQEIAEQMGTERSAMSVEQHW